MKTPRSPRRSAALGLSCLAAAALLAACGGGADGQPAIEAQAAEVSSDAAIDAPTVARATRRQLPLIGGVGSGSAFGR